MAVWRNNFEPEIKKLIQKVTGFEEFEENFQLCLQFAVSNIRYHRFLDVDSHKVNAAIKGYIEKFSIHSQYEKEKSFRTLVDKFLESPIFEGKDTGKTDTHYSLLLLLFKLSNSPTHQEYTPKILDLQKDDKKREDFDWFAYLMEGVEEPRRFFDDSEDELSSIEGDSEEEIRQSQGLSHSSNIKDVANDLNHSQQAPPFPDISLSTIPHNESTLLAENEEFHGTSEEWLRRNVVVQYWHGQNAPNAADSSNLHRDWRYFRRQVEPLHGNQEQTIITETPLIREILWMLSGVSDLYIFVYNGNAFSIREDVTLSHVTEQCLETYLLEFTRYGSYVQDLLKFQQNVLTQGINFKNSETNSASEEDNSQHWVCQTYQAFVASVDSFIKTLREYLRDLEKAIIKQEETILLGQLLDTLKPWLHKIHLVHSVYEKGIKTVEWSPSPCHRASCLLSIIYEIVIECQNFEEDSLNLMMTIWLDTCKPYLKIIDQWMTKGTLVDPMDEFIVKRNSDVKSLDESFWETAFTIHVPSEESLLADTQGTQFSDGSSLDQSKIRTLISHWAPQFLQPVLLYVVLAGKSMEMLQGMGCLGDVLGNKNNIFCKAIPLYDKFVDSLNTSLSVQSKGQTFKFESRGTGYQLYEDSVKPLMQIKGVYDPLLTINYQTVFMDPMSKLLRESSDFLEDTNYTREKSMPPDETSTLQRTLEDCLYPQVKERYLTVCRRLVDILKEQYNLLGYLSSMRQFFLMEAGDTMYEFYTQIFEKIRLKEHWRDSSTMNLILQEALAPNFPEEVNRLAIEIETLPPSTVHSPITLTDCLKLHYKVPWPVDVVINTKCQAVYNQVFQFLLQIKRAKYLLDRQRFSELNKADLFENVSLEEEKLKLEQEMPLAGRIHKIQILRMKLLNFVNSLHNYIMTRILHSTGLEFKGDMERAQDLDQIIELHGNYVQKLHERCMMHKKVSFIREAVMKVLNIVLSFHQLWSQNIHHVSVKYIDDMEMDFTRCIQFLATFLNNVIKRGSFPHLESLAFALRMMVVTNN